MGGLRFFLAEKKFEEFREWHKKFEFPNVGSWKTEEHAKEIVGRGIPFLFSFFLEGGRREGGPG